jgi:heme-degrading monooxygenase HmoA
MILEVAVLDVRPGSEAAFEAAFAEARSLIASIPGYLGLELQRCIEKPSRYVLLARWRRLEDHTEGFRGRRCTRTGSSCCTTSSTRRRTLQAGREQQRRTGR